MRSKDKELMKKIRSYVDEYALENIGRTQSTREIGEKFRMSNVTAFRYLKEMSELGIIKYRDGKIHSDLIDKLRPLSRLWQFGTILSQLRLTSATDYGKIGSEKQISQKSGGIA